MNKRADEYSDLGIGPTEEQGGGGFSLRKLKTFESFKNPVYRVYFGAIVSLWFAHSMQMISRNLLVYRLTDSGAILGYMALAQAIPSLAISLLGGAIADRLQKKYILIVGQLATAIISIWLAVTLSLGYLDVERWWLLMVAAALQGTVMGLIMPAQTAIIPEIVGEEKVMNAVSLTMMGQTALQLVGPALAGIIIEAYDFAAVYYLMTGISIVGVVITCFLPLTSKATTSGKNTLADMLEGLRYIRRDTTILLIVVFGIVHMISGLPYMYLLPMFTEDILNVGASGMGILASVSGIGSVIGSLVLASLPNKKRGIMLLFSGVIMGLSLIVFSWSTSWYLSLGIIPLVGLGPTMHGALTNTLVQYYVEPDYRGRMQSFVAMSSGLASFGTFLAGVMSETIGVQWSVGGMAVFLTIVSFIFFAFARRITGLE